MHYCNICKVTQPDKKVTHPEGIAQYYPILVNLHNIDVLVNNEIYMSL